MNLCLDIWGIIIDYLIPDYTNIHNLLCLIVTNKLFYKIFNRIEVWKRLYQKSFSVLLPNNIKNQYLFACNELKNKKKEDIILTSVYYGWEQMIDNGLVIDDNLSIEIIQNIYYNPEIITDKLILYHYIKDFTILYYKLLLLDKVELVEKLKINNPFIFRKEYTENIILQCLTDNNFRSVDYLIENKTNIEEIRILQIMAERYIHPACKYLLSKFPYPQYKLAYILTLLACDMRENITVEQKIKIYQLLLDTGIEVKETLLLSLQCPSLERTSLPLIKFWLEKGTQITDEMIEKARFYYSPEIVQYLENHKI